MCLRKLSIKGITWSDTDSTVLVVSDSFVVKDWIRIEGIEKWVQGTSRHGEIRTTIWGKMRIQSVLAFNASDNIGPSQPRGSAKRLGKLRYIFLCMGKYAIIFIIISDPSSDRPALEGPSDLQQDVQDRQQHPMWILPEEDIHLPEGWPRLCRLCQAPGMFVRTCKVVKSLLTKKSSFIY